MEVVVTGHNFESIPPKDHPCHVCFKLADWFQRRRLLNNFPIGLMLKLCPLMVAILNRDRGHWTQFWQLTTEGPSMICLLYWLTGFRGEYFKIFFPIVSYAKTMSAEGGHLGWRSGSLDTILKIYHLRTIHAMFALNWLTGFREEDF